MKTLPTIIKLNNRIYSIGNAEVDESNIKVEYTSVANGYDTPASSIKFDVEDMETLEAKLDQIGAIVNE